MNSSIHIRSKEEVAEEQAEADGCMGCILLALVCGIVGAVALFSVSHSQGGVGWEHVGTVQSDQHVIIESVNTYKKEDPKNLQWKEGITNWYLVDETWVDEQGKDAPMWIKAAIEQAFKKKAVEEIKDQHEGVYD